MSSRRSGRRRWASAWRSAARPGQVAVAVAVVRRGVRLAGLGVAGGLSGRPATSVLYGTSPTEPAIVLAMALLLTVAAVACYVPARRAMRVDAAQALRGE